MKTEFQMINPPFPEGTQQITESVHLRELMDEESKTLKIELYFPSKANPANIYMFTLYPDANFGSLTEITNDMVRQLYTGELQLPDDVKLDAMRVVQIGVGEMAADGRDYDDGDKIYYRLLNGSVLTTPAAAVDWENNIKRIHEMQYVMDHTRNLIVALLTKETVEIKKANEDGSEGETIQKNIIELATEELQKFHESNRLNIDYSMFTDNGITTERDVLIAQLIDVLEIHQQMITATIAVATRKQVADMYEQRVAAEKEAEPETVQAEVVSEE